MSSANSTETAPEPDKVPTVHDKAPDQALDQVLEAAEATEAAEASLLWRQLRRGYMFWFVYLPALAATIWQVLRSYLGTDDNVVTNVQITLGALAILFVMFCVYKMVAALLAPESAGHARAPASGWRRRDLEREKFWLLKAIKELEFDYEMKKISLEDFTEASGRYRARAIRVLRELDAKQPDYRALIEREVEDRVVRLRGETPAPRVGAAAVLGRKAAAAPVAAAPVAVVAAVAAAAPATPVCPSCQKENDLDASFCKKCGAALVAAGPLESRS